jgi:dTDP-glucose 4,6-dehydratase
VILRPLDHRDLEHVLDHSRQDWEQLRGGRLLLTGATGFFGIWILESFAWANRRLGLGAELLAVSRSPSAFRARAPHLGEETGIRWIEGDATTFEIPEEELRWIIHAATEQQRPGRSSLEVYERNVAATRRTLELAEQTGAAHLFTSSGAVYGRQPPELERLSEDSRLAPDPLDVSTAYGQSKRASEHLCAQFAAERGVAAKIARCFAFVGPHLPLDANYAVGNFVRDALAGGPIRVKGDGTALRTYLYAADLVIWLIAILARGAAGRAYNVGGEEIVSIGELAALTTRVTGCRTEPIVEGRVDPAGALGRAPDRYVSSVRRAMLELGLSAVVPIEEGIARMCGHAQAAAASSPSVLGPRARP